jgi:TonB family protein
MSCHNNWKFAGSVTAMVCALAFLAVFAGCGKNAASQSEDNKGRAAVTRTNNGAAANQRAAGTSRDDSGEMAALEARGVPRAFAERMLAALRARDAGALVALGKEARMTPGGGARPKDARAFAARCFDEAAKLGSAEGMMLAGRCAAEGFGEAADRARAVDWFIAAGDAGLADGYNAAARLLLDGKNAKVEIDTAMALIDKALATGSAEAKYLKGSLTLSQGGDVSAAFDLLMQAARADYPDAQFLLSRLYHEGKFLPKDDKVAAEWAKYAADSGLAAANADLGIATVRGKEGGMENMGDAMERLISAADKGHAAASLELAAAYLKASVGAGNQNRDDLNTGRNYAQQAFEQGNRNGAFGAAIYALLFSDYDDATAWLQRGSDANDWKSKYAYQLMTEDGKSLLEALKTAGKAPYEEYVNYSDARKVPASTGDAVPMLTTFAKPDMPASLSTMDIQSTVTVMFLVNKDGVPVDITVPQPSEYDALNQAAIDAVSKFRFKPGMKNGAPVSTRMMLPIQFKSHR